MVRWLYLKNKKYPLFNPEKFHDACGVGFVATKSGRSNPKVLPSALSALQRLTHRGAKAYDGNSGDGSGILVDIPREFFSHYLLKEHSFKISKNDTLAIASIFAKGINDKTIVKSFLDQTEKEKMRFLALRKVPTDENGQLQISSLRSSLNKIRSEGKKCFAVVATAGTTVRGAIDPLSEIVQFCKKEKVWLHVDGAVGGVYGLSKITSEIVKGLKEEILEATQMYMARNAPKAAIAMTHALYDPTELGIRDKMAAAKELLDRVGLVKTEKMQVEACGGVMLMPPKAIVEDDE